MRKYIYILAVYLIFFSCKDYEDEILNIDTSQPVDMSLIGSAVNFQPTVEGLTSRAANNRDHNGGFNTYDMMYIYRQYYNKETGEWDYHTPPGTLYRYTDLNNGVTGIFDKTSWKPYDGKWFTFQDSKYINSQFDASITEPSQTTAKYFNGNGWTLNTEENNHSYAKKLTENDSIIWENGQTVRFRAWVLSSLGNTLADPTYKVNGQDETKPGIKTINYPDYMTCDWVTVAGPTEQIPMSMKHLGCRIGFYPREYNVFTKIEISMDWQDYMRNDNADSFENDQDDKAPTEEEARERANAVKAAYKKMCWPAGVDIDDVSLLICDSLNNDNTYKHNTQSAEDIANKIRRPEFKSNSDSYWYMVTTPYDMSNSATSGEPITLPPFTRFRIWLRDVNNGDYQVPENNETVKKPSTSENNYHIFSLADIKKNREEMFPNGIELKSGYSYIFTVGYWHNKFSVYAYDNFSWADQDLGAIENIADETGIPNTTSTEESYSWWRTAMDEAAKDTKSTGGRIEYSPNFVISNADEFQEFINIINGNFNKTPIFKRVSIKIDKTTGRETSREVKWYRRVDIKPSGRDTVWVEKEELLREGYIIYDRYTPSVGTDDAKVEEEYLKTPFSFFNEQISRRWTVTLADNIDLKDIPLEPIGGKLYTYTVNNEERTDTTRFAGYFDGNGKKLKNLFIRKLTDNDNKNDFTETNKYIADFYADKENGTKTNVVNGFQDGMLFAYAQDGVIANLILESTHPLSICGKAWNERIIGCAVYAPSQTGTLANEAYGNCYFVGCAHYYMGANIAYNTGAPLVNNMENHYMYGCLQAAYSTNKGQPALGIAREDFREKYKNNGDYVLVNEIQDNRPTGDVWWTRVSCNYYDTELWEGALAYKNSYHYSDDYLEPRTINGHSSIHRLQYLRGVPTHVICAKNDYLIDAQTDWKKFSDIQKIEIYGVAPWKAMNYGIARYNTSYGREVIQKCKMRYYIDEKGYANKYPELKECGNEGILTTSSTQANEYWRNVLNELN